MEIAIIVAMTPQRVIGKNNQIPWHLPADLQRFKKITMGCPIVMGRKTFESLPGILPGRQHIVLTRNTSYHTEHANVVTDWQQVKQAAGNVSRIFVIGGANIYQYALPRAKFLYMTLVHADIEGDTYFPEWNESDWQEIEKEFRMKDKKNKFDMEFIQYRRKAS